MVRIRPNLLASAGLSQILWVGSNMVLNFLLARSLTTAEFGTFGIYYLSYTGAAMVFLSATVEVNLALVTNSAAIGRFQEYATLKSLPLILVVAAFGASFAFYRGWPTSFIIFSLISPWYLVHESLRALAAGVGSIKRLIVSDLVWLLALLSLVALEVASGRSVGASFAVVSWFASGAIGSSILLFGPLRRSRKSKLVDSERDLQLLFNESWRERLRSAANFLVVRLNMTLATASVGLFISPFALGQARYAQTLFGPLNMVIGGTRFVGLRVLKQGRRLNGLYFALVASWAAIFGFALLAPQAVWLALLGRSNFRWGWVLYAVGAERFAAAVSAVPTLELRERGFLERIWSVRYWATGCAVLAGMLLLLLGLNAAAVATWIAGGQLLAAVGLLMVRTGRGKLIQ